MQTQKQIQGWEWKKLGELVDCLDSKRIPLNSKERESKKGNIPYYGANGQVDSINDFLFDEELLLLAEDGGSWGHKEKCAYVIKGKSWVNNHAHVLRMKQDILIKFLEFFLNLNDLRMYVSGTTRGKLNQKRMNEIPIPVPPLEVQKQIVAVLERAEKLKQRREQINNEMKSVIQSIFVEMFGDPIKNEKGWEVKRWGDVLEIINGKSQKEVQNPEGQYPIYGSGGIMGYANDYLTPEDAVIVGRKGTINKPIKVKTKFWNVDTAFGIVPKKESLNVDYLFGFCEIFNFNSLNSSTTLPSLTKSSLLNIKIPVPPLSLQKEFEKIVEKIESIKKYQIGVTDETSILFDALMQKAFNGEL